MRTQQDYGHEQANDPRRADVEYARQLLDAAQESGLVALPSLTVDELLVLGAGEQAVLDETILRAWDGLPDERRFQLADETIAGLVERGLLEPAPNESIAVAASHGSDASDGEDEERMRTHPALATILLARTFPTWLALCSTQGARHTGLRMFGLGDVQDSYRGVVVETPERTPGRKPSTHSSGQVPAASYQYRLASTVAAATLLAGWAISSHAAVDVEEEPEQSERLIDLFVHRDGEPLIRRRIQICRDQQGNAYVGTGPQQHQRHDRDSLTELLHSAVRALRSR